MKEEKKEERKEEIMIVKLTVSEQNAIHGGRSSSERASSGDKSAGTHDSTDCCGCVCAWWDVMLSN